MELTNNPTRDEISSAVKKLNSEKAPDANGFTAEILKSGGFYASYSYDTLLGKRFCTSRLGRCSSCFTF